MRFNMLTWRTCWSISTSNKRAADQSSSKLVGQYFALAGSTTYTPKTKTPPVNQAAFCMQVLVDRRCFTHRQLTTANIVNDVDVVLDHRLVKA
jgi:hypothetical protein